MFIGSCTNSRIEDLRAAAAVAAATRSRDSVHAMVVPGSGLVKAQAEAEGLDKIFIDAGFEWRDAGCSMCLGMNPDFLLPGERCASTSNRNFEGRQGPGGRTHLVSPPMAAAAAIAGHFVDIRDWKEQLDGSRYDASSGKAPAAATAPTSTPTRSSRRSTSSASSAPASASSLRRLAQGSATFVLNDPLRRRAGAGRRAELRLRLVARARALGAQDYGFKAIIAPSFADIFRNNCAKIGLLTGALPQDEVDILMQRAKRSPAAEIVVDLESQTVASPASEWTMHFDIDPFVKHCLLNGLDDIGLTLQHADEISAFEKTRPGFLPVDGGLDELDPRPSPPSRSRRAGLVASCGSTPLCALEHGEAFGILEAVATKAEEKHRHEQLQHRRTARRLHRA